MTKHCIYCHAPIRLVKSIITGEMEWTHYEYFSGLLRARYCYPQTTATPEEE